LQRYMVHSRHTGRRTPAAPVACLLSLLCGSAPAAELELPPSAGLRTGYVRQRLRAWPVGAGDRCAGELDERADERALQHALGHALHGVGDVPEAARCPSLRLSSPSSGQRSEEHTSELQSRENLVCRLLLEK